MKIKKHKINSRNTKLLVSIECISKAPKMKTIFTHIYNIALKTSLLCLIFIFGNLNKCSVLKHEGFVERHGSSVLKHEGFVERHGSSVLKHEGFVERHGSSVLKHEDFVERHRSSAETNKHLFYKNKSPP